MTLKYYIHIQKEGDYEYKVIHNMTWFGMLKYHCSYYNKIGACNISNQTM